MAVQPVVSADSRDVVARAQLGPSGVIGERLIVPWPAASRLERAKDSNPHEQLGRLRIAGR
jgi:hypothetical protein